MVQLICSAGHYNSVSAAICLDAFGLVRDVLHNFLVAVHPLFHVLEPIGDTFKSAIEQFCWVALHLARA